ncbi:MAG: hypothetical protein NZT92_06465 [Abditibacteriales bacterium]|nr:hypothetical protein [Abditibacteriales bacterium]MDW8365702.1 hypothetical protein [Abditibacteriales bacterium]
MRGVQVHDAYLVAAMRVHGITNLLTFNVGDFASYPGITAVHPQDIEPEQTPEETLPQQKTEN